MPLQVDLSRIKYKWTPEEIENVNGSAKEWGWSLTSLHIQKLTQSACVS
jgi:hypothetical protein